jgi:hypothetical protein
MELLSRDDFRNGVLSRDGHLCVVCKKPAQDAHHIIDRRLWSDGGYYLDNGASLCGECHVKAEQTVLSCFEIREAAGISAIALPAHFDREESYDKWANVYLGDGRRAKGELFYDESVQAILKSGGVLNQFDHYVKFPKISHVPWSASVDARTDRIFSMEKLLESFEGKEVVVTEKMDGENTTGYRDYIHARSIDGRNHPSRSWVKQLHSAIANDIPEGWRISGENLFARHSIFYKGLPSFFLVFAIYDQKDECLPWDETVEYANLLGLKTVPVLYRGVYDDEKVKACFKGKSTFGGSEQEGYVMRLASAIPWPRHTASFAKFVRKNHVQTTHNWMHEATVRNELEETP